MTRALLDVNVLIALLDADHVDHRRAHEWLDDGMDDGWASCAITENGFVRMISQPRYPSPVAPAAAIELLARACDAGPHEFWSCSISLLDAHVVDRSRLQGLARSPTPICWPSRSSTTAASSPSTAPSRSRQSGGRPTTI